MRRKFLMAAVALLQAIATRFLAMQVCNRLRTAFHPFGIAHWRLATAMTRVANVLAFAIAFAFPSLPFTAIPALAGS